MKKKNKCKKVICNIYTSIIFFIHMYIVHWLMILCFSPKDTFFNQTSILQNMKQDIIFTVYEFKV